jgi:hypothetical protein
MVMIQPEEENEETVLQNLPKPQATASTSKTTTSDTTTTKENGSDSDGFETASERGVSDNEEEDIVNKGINPENSADDQQQQQHTQNDAELIQVFPSLFLIS